MNCSETGNLIYLLRKEKNLTQRQLADLMGITDKAISKWERGLGCPDVCLLPSLSQIFGVNIEEILLGKINLNQMVGGNMKKLKFYVCPQCNNLMTTTGLANISCCGKKIEALSATKADEFHRLTIEPVEDELYFSSSHEMSKDHYITFAAYVAGDRFYLIKQYPEWNLQIRFPNLAHGKLYFHCSKHGLFYQLY